MELLKLLSSKQGDTTEKSNRIVAELCIKNPKLIAEISSGFINEDKKLQSDSIEVFTMIAEEHPDLIVPYADKILPLLANKQTKTRWEAVHTLSYIADKVPEIIGSVLPELQYLVEKDNSTIVRDYTLDTIANYAKINKESAIKAFAILKSALALWEEKHAKQVFKGFNHIIDINPSYKAEIGKMAQPYLGAKKNIVAKEAARIIKKTEK
ncbi:MAG: hypothetical protein JXB34_09415 [Bacteroidales bacterium]|nr:hypothetical protein [Bacteroidales bacterium]